MPENNENANTGEQLYDLGKLKEMSRGNDAFVKKMIQLFADRIPTSLQQIHDAYNAGDYQTVRDIAHFLKPSIDNMGVSSIRNQVRAIEDLALDDPASPLLLLNINKIDTVLMIVFEQLKEYTK